jgi:hypothetical protein
MRKNEKKTTLRDGPPMAKFEVAEENMTPAGPKKAAAVP